MGTSVAELDVIATVTESRVFYQTGRAAIAAGSSARSQGTADRKVRSPAPA